MHPNSLSQAAGARAPSVAPLRWARSPHTAALPSPRPPRDPVRSPRRLVGSRRRPQAFKGSRKPSVAVAAEQQAGESAPPAAPKQQRQRRAPRNVTVQIADVQPGQEYEGTVVRVCGGARARAHASAGAVLRSGRRRPMAADARRRLPSVGPVAQPEGRALNPPAKSELR